jgi:AraC family transcriptional regulator of adaptative response / DNA-3-methyladenine glycosylase II
MDEHLPEVESLAEGRYGRTVRLEERAGLVLVTDGGSEGPAHIKHHLVVDVSTALLPVLMPLLSRLRHLFDLDAQPAMVDQHLAQGGLDALVQRRPGLRIPGTLDGFEAGLRVLLAEGRARGGDPDAGRRLVEALGQPMATGVPGLSRLSPTAESIAALGSPQRLEQFGIPAMVAQPLLALARAMADGRLRLEPHRDRMWARRALLVLPGMDEQRATRIAMRALYWPDGLPVSDTRLQRAAGVSNEVELENLAEQWRPWRAYAALHLGLAGNEH